MLQMDLLVKKDSRKQTFGHFSQNYSQYMEDWVKMYNDVHNILRPCDSGAIFPFTTIKKKRDY